MCPIPTSPKLVRIHAYDYAALIVPTLLCRMPVVMPQCVLFAAGAAEGRHALEVADHAGAVIDIAAAAGAARFSGAFVDVTALQPVRAAMLSSER